MTHKQRIIDFIEGRTDSREFLSRLYTDTELLNWIQTSMPLKRCSQRKPSYLTPIDGFECAETVPFNIRIELANKNGVANELSLGEVIDIQHLLYCCFTENFPHENVTLNTSIMDKFDFILANTPVCIGGNGVDLILEEIYDSTDGCKTRSERIRAFRGACRERFHIEGRRYPRWTQCAQWPIASDGEPMHFLRQKAECDGCCEFVNYYFFDHVGNAEVIVNQTV